MSFSEEEIALLTPEKVAPVDPTIAIDMASRNDPERSAEVFNIANKRDIPTGAVEPNLDEYKRLEQSTAVPTSSMGKNVLDLINNPDTANIVHDDLANLTETEAAMTPTLLDDILGVAHAGILDIGTGAAGGLQGFFELQQAPKAAEFFRRVAESGKSKSDEVFPDIENEYAGAAVSGVRSAVNFMTLMAATRGQALIPMAMQAAGSSYHSAREQDLSVEKAVPYAVIQGGIEWATEKIPMNKLLGDLAEGSGLVKTLKDQLLTELPTEQVATIFQDLNDWAMLPENEEKPFMEYLKERPNAALHTAIATVTGTAVQTTAVHTANTLVNRDRDPVATTLVREGQQIAISEAEQGRLDQIISLAQESKVNERAQDVYKQFLEGAGSEQSVFLPVDIISGNVDTEIPQAILDQIDGLGGDVEIPMDVFMSEVVHDEALMELLRPHMKMGADQLSASEIESGGEMTVRRLLERAQANADIKTEADEIFAQVRGQLENTGRVTKSEARLAAQLYPAVAAIQAERYGISPAEVFERMGLTIEGPGGAPVAADSVVMTQAQESGYEGNTQVEAAEWNQGVAKYGAEGMTTEARMARAEEQGYDTETVYYHGTAKEGYVSDTDIKQFDADKTGDRWSADEKGFFFTSSKDESNYYANSDRDYRNKGEGGGAVYPVHLKTDNPLVVDSEFLAKENMSDVIAKDGTVSFWDTYQSLILEWMEDAGADSVILVDRESGDKMVMVSDPANIRSVNAAFNEDSVDNTNILAQSQVDKRRSMVEKLLECVRNTG